MDLLTNLDFSASLHLSGFGLIRFFFRILIFSACAYFFVVKIK